MADRLTKKEKARIFAAYESGTKEESMSELPGRNWSAVGAAARRLGLKRSKNDKGVAIANSRIKNKE